MAKNKPTIKTAGLEVDAALSRLLVYGLQTLIKENKLEEFGFNYNNIELDHTMYTHINHVSLGFEDSKKTIYPGDLFKLLAKSMLFFAERCVLNDISPNEFSIIVDYLVTYDGGDYKTNDFIYFNNNFYADPSFGLETLNNIRTTAMGVLYGLRNAKSDNDK